MYSVVVQSLNSMYPLGAATLRWNSLLHPDKLLEKPVRPLLKVKNIVSMG